MKNKILLFCGLLLCTFGTICIVRMFVYNSYPDYSFFIFCFVGLVQTLTAFINNRIEKSWQLLWVFIPIIIWFSYLEIQSSSKDIFLIPDGFKGKVTIQYEQKNGVEKEFEKFWWRVYRIPRNGILKTKFAIKGNSISYSDSKYYFVEEKGNRKPIKQFCDYCKEKDTLNIQVLSGKLVGEENGNYQEFYIDFPKNKYNYE
jgi:hypothetical protein